MTELKPCPFCGGKAELAIYYDFYRFHCPDPECEAHLPDGVVVNGIGNWHASITDARNAWNTRSERTCRFEGAPDEPPTCSACGFVTGIYDCDWYDDEPKYVYAGKYCSECGAKVVER